MSQIQWTTDYLVGHDTIDTQHHKLIDMINDLEEAICQNFGNEILENIIAEMTDYAFEHFSTEEKLMHQMDYPDKINHIKQHDYFKYTIDHLASQKLPTNLSLPVQVHEFLTKWLTNHIMTVDKELGQFLAEKQTV